MGLKFVATLVKLQEKRLKNGTSFYKDEEDETNFIIKL